VASPAQVSACVRQVLRNNPTLTTLAVVRQWRIVVRVRFVETAVFTRRIVELLSDVEYTRLQRSLIREPRAGKVIQGTGGLRKVRWGDESRHRGRRGGIRVIYYWYQSGEEFFMLLDSRRISRET
jgi:hypothetical protein